VKKPLESEMHGQFNVRFTVTFPAFGPVMGAGTWVQGQALDLQGQGLKHQGQGLTLGGE